jgi:hypothetical protein
MSDTMTTARTNVSFFFFFLQTPRQTRRHDTYGEGGGGDTLLDDFTAAAGDHNTHTYTTLARLISGFFLSLEVVFFLNFSHSPNVTCIY